MKDSWLVTKVVGAALVGIGGCIFVQVFHPDMVTLAIVVLAAATIVLLNADAIFLIRGLQDREDTLRTQLGESKREIADLRIELRKARKENREVMEPPLLSEGKETSPFFSAKFSGDKEFD